jgi:hypothetical protein
VSSGDVEDIFISSGVNEKLEGFCTVSINNGDMLGQLSPAEVRALALQWLGAAEAAESDSLVFRVAEEHGLEREVAAVLVMEMRKLREP